MDDGGYFIVLLVVFVMTLFVTGVITEQVRDRQWERKCVSHGVGTYVVVGNKTEYQWND